MTQDKQGDNSSLNIYYCYTDTLQNLQTLSNLAQVLKQEYTTHAFKVE